MNYFRKIIEDIEVHNEEGIRDCFRNGVDPNILYNGEPLINELIGGYLRGPSFKKCIRAFVESGVQFEDKVLLNTLLDDDNSLEKNIENNPELVSNKYTLRCAFTPLHETTLLHICAEFNHVNCAKILITYGANVNARAGLDEYGFGGQTPVFHTVNQNRHQSADVMNYLLQNSCDLQINVRGLIWGKGFEWETFIPAVNPISYALMGLLPQMHRDEKTTAEVVERLIKEAFGIQYRCKNIPNKYLSQ